MHAVQSAMAVRREREKREQRRQSQIRRSSSKSPRASDASHASADHSAGQLATEENPIEKAPNPAESSMTAFHLGVVFILLGFLMVFSADHQLHDRQQQLVQPVGRRRDLYHCGSDHGNGQSDYQRT